MSLQSAQPGNHSGQLTLCVPSPFLTVQLILHEYGYHQNQDTEPSTNVHTGSWLIAPSLFRMQLCSPHTRQYLSPGHSSRNQLAIPQGIVGEATVQTA